MTTFPLAFPFLYGIEGLGLTRSVETFRFLANCVASGGNPWYPSGRPHIDAKPYFLHFPRIHTSIMTTARCRSRTPAFTSHKFLFIHIIAASFEWGKSANTNRNDRRQAREKQSSSLKSERGVFESDVFNEVKSCERVQLHSFFGHHHDQGGFDSELNCHISGQVARNNCSDIARTLFVRWVILYGKFVQSRRGWYHRVEFEPQNRAFDIDDVVVAVELEQHRVSLERKPKMCINHIPMLFGRCCDGLLFFFFAPLQIRLDYRGQSKQACVFRR